MLDFVHRWKTLWERDGAEAYLALYAPEFKSRGKGLKEWSAYKLRVNRLNQKRRIQVTPTRIEFDGTEVSIDLLQQFNSTRINDLGLKQLGLKSVPAGTYLITSEEW
ncbi:MAG: L,D-transpeptidase Cds6 family protein, partial [bacterium]